MTLNGPDKRFTDTIAPMRSPWRTRAPPCEKHQGPGDAGVSGRLVAIPPGAKYDTASRRLQWTIPRSIRREAAASGLRGPHGGISAYEINVESKGDNALYLKDARSPTSRACRMSISSSASVAGWWTWME